MRSIGGCVELLNERTEIVEEIGRVKREAQLPVYEPKREDQVFDNIASANQGPHDARSGQRIFERIIDEMRSVQKRPHAGRARRTKECWS